MRRAQLATCVLSALCVAACQPAAESPAAPAVSTPAPDAPRAANIPTQAQLDQFRAEGSEPTLRKIAAVDYYLHYRLMQATGLEEALGGEDKAAAALLDLG